MKMNKSLEDFIAKVKEKLPVHVAKNPELKNREQKQDDAFENLKMDADTKLKDKAKKRLFKFTIGREKDVQARRELKQSEKGIIFIAVALLGCYFIYTNFYTVKNKELKGITSLKVESVDKRNEIETQLALQDQTKTEIADLEKQMQLYKSMYPNYRTQNEVLVVLNSLLGSHINNVTSITVNNSIPVTKTDINASITAKGLSTVIENATYFTPSKEAGADTTQSTSDTTQNTTNADGTANPDGTGTTAPDTKFEYSETTFTVGSINSMSEALQIVKALNSSNRIIIPSRLKITGIKGTYAVEGTLYFYAYRNSQDAENLF